MFWSEASCSWFCCFYFFLLIPFLIFFHLSSNSGIEFGLFNSSVAFLLTHLIFIKLNLVIIIAYVACLDIVSLFQFLLESIESVVECSSFPRMSILEDLIILIWFNIIRIEQLFQRSKLLINDRTNKTIFVSLFRENWLRISLSIHSWLLLEIQIALQIIFKLCTKSFSMSLDWFTRNIWERWWLFSLKLFNLFDSLLLFLLLHLRIVKHKVIVNSFCTSKLPLLFKIFQLLYLI